MTDLSRLSVSLTKHNAHKVAQLLKDYPAGEVFSHLSEVRADNAQAGKNLSISPEGEVPSVWSDAQKLGPDAIDALVLLAIIFSHHALIEAMQSASFRDGTKGTIERGVQLEGKAYTNFARILDQLGYATRLVYEGVAFDLAGLFSVSGLGPLVAQLLQIKFRSASWNEMNSIDEEAISLGLQNVFGISAEELRDWLASGRIPADTEDLLLPKDRQFFEQKTEGLAPSNFVFQPGHVQRETEPLERTGSAKARVSQLHNEIQNGLYGFLEGEVGENNVGTEIDTGVGTTIDVAARSNGSMTFYEIKTAPSVRASIRQALPQLLEYAHWPREERAERLVVVSHLRITEEARAYLDYLRERYSIPIEYRQFDIEAGELI